MPAVERDLDGYRLRQRYKGGYTPSLFSQYNQPFSWSSSPYTYTQSNYYQQGFPQYERPYQPPESNTRDIISVMTTETEPEQKSTEVSHQMIGPLPLWTPELYADPKTGEMHSKSGDSTIYTNGLEHPLMQLYVDSKVSRNMPAHRTTWDPNTPFPTPAQPKPESEYQQQEFQEQETQELEYQGHRCSGQKYQPQAYRGQEYQRQNYQEEEYQLQEYQTPDPEPLHIIDYEQIYPPPPPQSQPHYLPRWAENNTYWPLVHEIYGTAIGIILKCMSRQLPHTTIDPFTQDSWLQSQGLPFPATRRFLDRYYFPSGAFRQVGDRVAGSGVRKRRELKERINKGLEAGKWPGDTDFSEMRNTCEVLRKKGLEFLERWGDLFEMEWVAARQQQRRKEVGYY